MRRYAVFARVGAGIMLLVCWGLIDSPLLGVVYILLLVALSAVRYRVSPYRWLGFFEAAASIIFACLWLPALLGLWLPFIGLLEDKWAMWEDELLKRSFDDRAERLKLEAFNVASAREVISAARLAEIAERSRIAQDIHDHVGHEISGASMALQTALKLYEKGDERAGDLLAQSAKRIEAASEHLREAVHNLKPSRVAGVSTLAEICEAFTFCPAQFSASGDLGGSLHWELLEANLKEALTNVSRHSEATSVTVRVDGNPDYIRLQITDNGKAERSTKNMGLGLTGIRERVRAVGGSLAVSTENGFTVTCLLPKGKGSEEY